MGILEKLCNFHGSIKSNDYRLAVEAYNTAAWEELMTDVSDEIDSNSSKATATEDHVERLIKHLAEVGISNTATLIAIGSQPYRILEANKDLIHGNIERVLHYSVQNRDNGKGGYWDTDKVNQLLQQISKED